MKSIVLVIYILYWQKTDKIKLKRINTLIQDSLRDPFEGIGNPEPLKHALQGFFSRRIDKQHRLVYTFAKDELSLLGIVQIKNHTIKNGTIISESPIWGEDNNNYRTLEHIFNLVKYLRELRIEYKL